MDDIKDFKTKIENLIDGGKFQETITCLTDDILNNHSDFDLFYWKSFAYFSIGEYGFAFLYLSKCAHIDEGNILCNFLRAEIWFALGNYEMASIEYSTYIADTQDIDLILKRGQCFENLNSYEFAIEDFLKAIDLEPESPAGYINLGCCYQNMNMPELALKYFEKSLSINRSPEVLYLCGKAKDTMNKYDEAITFYTKAIAINDKKLDAYIARAKSFEELEQWNNSIEDFSIAISLDPTNFLLYTYRSYSWLSLNNYDRALKDLSVSEQLHNKSYLTTLYKGIVLLETGKYEAAISCFGKVIKLKKEEYLGYYYRAEANFYLENYTKAIKDYDECIALNKKASGAFSQRGACYVKKKKFMKAFFDYSEAIKHSPHKKEYYLERGVVNQLMFEYDNALIDFTMAINLEPDHHLSYYHRGALYSLKRDYQSAIDDLSMVIKIDPNFDSAIYLRGICYCAMDNTSKGESDFLELITRNNLNSMAYHGLATLAIQQARYAECDHFCKMFLSLNNNVNSYQSKVCKQYLLEVNEILKNQRYREVFELVNSIKKVLRFSGQYVAHYTSLTASRALILNNELFRVSEGAYLNDTSEGMELFKYLDIDAGLKMSGTKLDLTEEIFVQRPFIASFVTEDKQDDLTLWRMYGKEGFAEASGCAITIDSHKLTNSLIDGFVSNDEAEIKGYQNAFGYEFYHVAYKDPKGKFILSGQSAEKQEELNNLIDSLKKVINNSNLANNMKMHEVLNSIAFLFKSAEYQFESEVRLVVPGVGFTKQIEKDQNTPRTYISLLNLNSLIHSITLGPKVTQKEEWAAAFNYHLNKDMKGNYPTIFLSRLPFK